MLNFTNFNFLEYYYEHKANFYVKRNLVYDC